MSKYDEINIAANVTDVQLVDASACFKDYTFKNNSIINDTATLVIKWTKVEAETKQQDWGNVKEMTLKLVFFADNRFRYWSLTSESLLHVDFEKRGKNDFKLSISDTTWASQGFSYSCSMMQLKSPPVSNVTNYYATNITMQRFQVQPFQRFRNNSIFNDSFDCATWTSMATWMGLIVVIVLTIILASGIYMIADIKTNDKFENPKGKTLTINVAE